MKELLLAIDSVKTRSAPGADQIDYNIIKNLTPDSLSVLLQIYNNLFCQEIFRAEWNKSMVVLISKPNGKGVRPISLLSCLLKIMEKIIYLRLRWFIKSNAILPPNQTGTFVPRVLVPTILLL